MRDCLAIDAVDAQLKTSAWDVAWPLLLFLLLPVAARRERPEEGQ